MVECIQFYALDKAVATKEGDHITVKCGDYSVMTVGKTIIVGQYLRDSIIGSATGSFPGSRRFNSAPQGYQISP